MSALRDMAYEAHEAWEQTPEYAKWLEADRAYFLEHGVTRLGQAIMAIKFAPKPGKAPAPKGKPDAKPADKKAPMKRDKKC